MDGVPLLRHTIPLLSIASASDQRFTRLDSIPLPIDSLKIGLPITTVDYKWLVNVDHYPALWVTSTVNPDGSETITTIKYRDVDLDTGSVNKVASVAKNMTAVKAWPNPATDGLINFDIPTSWQPFQVQLYDVQSKQVAATNNEREINIAPLPHRRLYDRAFCQAAMLHILK